MRCCRVVIDVQRNDDDAQPESRQIQRDPIDAVSQAHGDAVARLEAQRLQRDLPASDQRGELADADVGPAVVGIAAIQRSVRRRQMLREEFRDVRHWLPLAADRTGVCDSAAFTAAGPSEKTSREVRPVWLYSRFRVSDPFDAHDHHQAPP
jgi:hypothetical protein